MKDAKTLLNVLFLLVVSIFTATSVADIMGYKTLEGDYYAFLLRYEEDFTSSRPHRHKHAIIQINYADGKDLVFRTSRSGSIEWIPSGQHLKVLIRRNPAGGKPDYEVDYFTHLYSDTALFLFLGILGGYGLFENFRRRRPAVPVR